MSAERLRRWRLVLGGTRPTPAMDARPERRRPADRRRARPRCTTPAGAAATDAPSRGAAGLGGSAPRVARWLGDIRAYFPSSVVQVMQHDAIERLGPAQLLLEPEMLEAVEPDVHLVGTLLSASTRRDARRRPRRPRGRWSARSSTTSSSGSPTAPGPAVTGALDRAARTHRPSGAPTSTGTARSAPTSSTTCPSTAPSCPSGWSGTAGASSTVAARRHPLRSTSPARWPRRSSTRASSARCWPRCASLRTSLVVFDTAVVDLTDELHDPVECCSAPSSAAAPTSTGAIAYCQGLVTRPTDTIFVLISDLFEGGVRDEMLRRVAQLTRAGVQVVVLLALSDEGAPATTTTTPARSPRSACPPSPARPTRSPT